MHRILSILLFILTNLLIFSSIAQAIVGQGLYEYFTGKASKCITADFDKEDRTVNQHFEMINDYVAREKFCKAALQSIALSEQHPSHQRVRQFPERTIELLIQGEHWTPAIVEVHNYFIKHPEGVEAFKAEKMYFLLTVAYGGAQPEYRNDQTLTMEGIEAYQGFLDYFPDSPYRNQVQTFLSIALDKKSRYEAIEVGGYYLKQGLQRRKERGRYMAAAYNRIKSVFVIRDFEGSPVEGQAFGMLYQALDGIEFPIKKKSIDEPLRCISEDEPRMIVGGLKKFVENKRASVKILNHKGRQIKGSPSAMLSVMYDRLAQNELCVGKKGLEDIPYYKSILGNEFDDVKKVIFLNAAFDRFRNVFFIKEFQKSSAAPEALAQITRIAAALARLSESTEVRNEWSDKVEQGLQALRKEFPQSQWHQQARSWAKNPGL